MKFQSISAFEKHLKDAFPAHLSEIFMVVSDQDLERKRTAQKIAQLLLQKEPGMQECFFEGEESFEKVLLELNTKPLFGGRCFIFFDRIDALKKDQVELLAGYLENPSSFAYLILGGASAKNSAELYQKGKKEVVFLNMSDEKPWEKQKRLKEWLIAAANKENKILSAAAASFLLEQVGSDMAALEQELLKLICYAGDRKNLELTDAKTITSSYTSLTTWQMAENIVWDQEPYKTHFPHDLSLFLALISGVRYHLQIGCQIFAGGTVPNLRPASLEKYIGVVKRRGDHFFYEGLQALFEIELLAKNSSLAPTLLHDLLISRIFYAKQTCATSFSKSSR